MSFASYLGVWVNERQSELSRLGKVHFNSTADERNNPSAHLVVESDELAVDLIVWDSGDAEVAFMEAGQQATQQHYEFEQVGELEIVLRQLIGKFGGS